MRTVPGGKVNDAERRVLGFTLIELLVVIAIIGLLSTLSIVALNTARAKARDTRRQTDVREIQVALEMYYSDLNQYPPSGTLAASTSLSSGGFLNIASGTVYMGNVPTNPTPVNDGLCSGTPAYTYTQQGSGNSYSLSYCLAASGFATATPAGIK